MSTLATRLALFGEDLVRIGAHTDGSPHWLGVWSAAEDNPRHAGLELWMAIHGHRIVGKPAS